MPTATTSQPGVNDRTGPVSPIPPALPPPLPPKVGYYLRHLLAGRFRLVPSEASAPPLKGRALTFTRDQLRHIPESPQFQETLARVDGTISKFKGWLHADSKGAPVLFLDGLGGWTLRLPKYGKTFQALRELKSPEALRPWRSYEDPERNGRPLRRRHLIPLRYHERAFLVLAVLRYPSSHVGYEAWVWNAARKLDIPLYWEEAQRCIGLFRDLAASWLWVEGAARKPDDVSQSDPPSGQTPAGENESRVEEPAVADV